MPQENGNGRPRLDSWKQIAAYLHRDIATVRRWEKTLGLPIRRVPGSRGHTVFAYVADIDAWLDARERGESAPAQTPPLSALPPAPVRRVDYRWLAGAGVLMAIVTVAWLALDARVSPDTLRVEVTEDGVIAYDNTGRERWRSPFSAAYHNAVMELADTSVVAGGAHPRVFAGYSHRVGRSNDLIESGALLRFDLRGHLQRSFSFDDQVTVDGKPFGPPWGINSFAVDARDGGQRVAVAGHHLVWSPSLVTVLNDDGGRLGTFVHNGWIEHVRWLTPSRLIIAGFSDAEDAGTVALLDADALERGVVDRVVMPRSEINRVTGSRFNRAVLQVLPDRILVRTIEVPSSGMEGIDAVYEFKRSEPLELITASFSGRYWDLHRSLEAQGKITHTREHCAAASPRVIANP